MCDREYLVRCSSAEFATRLQGVRPANGTPVAGDVYLMAVLDGSDQFAEAHGDDRASRKETLHGDFCRRQIHANEGALLDRTNESWHVEPLYRDAVLGRFSGTDALCHAIAAACAIHRYLELWNLERQLSWIDQLHGRIAVSSTSWEAIYCLVQQAQRDETVLDSKDWARLSHRERTLLGGGMAVREGVSREVVEEFDQEVEAGIGPFAVRPDWATRIAERAARIGAAGGAPEDAVRTCARV